MHDLDELAETFDDAERAAIRRYLRGVVDAFTRFQLP
jgi:hypothetical protein